MKERELREHAVCSLCGEKIGHSGLPIFCRVTVEQFSINLNAVQRQTGLAMTLGHAGLASVMGPDEEMAHEIDRITLTVCHQCAINGDTPIAALHEVASGQD